MLLFCETKHIYFFPAKPTAASGLFRAPGCSKIAARLLPAYPVNLVFLVPA